LTSIGWLVDLSTNLSSDYFITMLVVNSSNSYSLYEYFILKMIALLSYVKDEYIYYQQSGDAKKPYLAQYSAVCEDTPVRES
jgi:hypothetical protein